MSYPSYPELKDSGVEWLGEIPKYWEVNPLKHSINFIEGPGILATDFVDEGIPLLRIAGIGGRTATLEGCNFLSPASVEKKWAHFRVQMGDLLISGSASTGFCTEVDETTIGAIPYTGIIIIRPRLGLADKDFIRWFLLSDQFLTQVDLCKAGSTIQHFGPSHLSRMSIELPTLSEQQAIAAFLDRKTAELDELIRLKERQIELLGVKRQALISHAVTRGLDPSVKLRPSGIEWLGEIPTHWEVTKIKFGVSKIGSGRTPKGGAETYVDEGVIFLRSQNVHDDGLRLDDVVYISEKVDEEMAETRVKSGDVLLNITGASIGRTCLVPADFPPANVNQHVCIIRPKRVAPEFLSYFLKSNTAKDQIRSLENGSSREGLNFEQVGNLLLVYPRDNESEQIAIADFLDRETLHIDKVMQAVQTQISQLREYRQALISAAVTGKIDVRGVSV